MPPLPKIHTGALIELAEELRFAPREALLRDIDRAEGLAGEIEAGLQYPADWVVFRVTGYRPEMDDPALIPGEALLGDLSSLVERLCDAAGLTVEDMDGGEGGEGRHPHPGPLPEGEGGRQAGERAVPLVDDKLYETADELAARWGVSRKTISRWRRRGLIARRVHEADGTTRLVVTAKASSVFADRHGGVLARAAGFSRIDPATEAAIVRRARRYHEVLGLPITQIAERIGTKYDRSAEAVRQVLLRHDAGAIGRGEEPIFGEPRALDERTQRVIERAWRRGIEPGELMKRYRRSRAGIHRIINEQRLKRLRSLDLGHIAERARALDAKGIEKVLGAEPVGAFDDVEVPRDIRELIALMRERVVPVGVEERAWARAEHALRARATRLIGESGRGGFPEARLIDRAETDLRWAAQLRAALGQVQLHLVLETLETKLGMELSHMRGQEARVIVEAGLRALREGLDAFDPWTRGRLASPVGLAAARVRVEVPDSEGGKGTDGNRKRAQVRMLSGTAAPDWTVCISPWVVGLRLDARLERVAEDIPEDFEAVLTERYGLGGVRPRTLAEVAKARGITEMQAGRLERLAIHAALGGDR
ncbi:hypothetical protein MNBD_PLANCTO03-153 [hydrothermal vent metagenome]|uniref:Uncharacterized protein n=1 Tax=hydrothermal vent metagenome TaxID=652676 RepID=A0A3B1DW75_9ZZZZ